MKIITLQEVIDLVSLSKSTIYLRIKKNEFPKQVDLGGSRVGWSEEEIKTWIIDKIKNRDRNEKC